MKLTLKDYAPHLAYGLKIYNNHYKQATKLDTDDLIGGFIKYNTENDIPYFRPLSSLFKPLKDGSVPIVELAKIANSDYEEYLNPKVEEEYGTYSVEFENWRGGYDGCTDLAFNPSRMYFAKYEDGEGWCGVDNIHLLLDYLYTNHFWLGNQSYFEKGIILNLEEIEG